MNDAAPWNSFRYRPVYLEVILIVWSQVFTSSGQLVTGSSVRRKPNA